MQRNQGVAMSDGRAVEIRHEGRIHRADSMETLLHWAREHRLSIEDHYREAGTDQWLPIRSHEELARLLDPENWWTLRMSGKTFMAPDWETVVRWTREGRLTEDVQIEGPKTPPGGILGKASPELAPYLREPLPEQPEFIPPKLQFDGRTFLPGDLDTVRDWISESRVPLEATISIDNQEWQPLSECGHFEIDLWPTDALETRSEPMEVSEPASETPTESLTDSERASPEVDRSAQESEEGTDAETGAEIAEGEVDASMEPAVEPYRITTTFGDDYLLLQPKEILTLLKKKKIHSFDEVRHPALPDGTMFVSEFIEVMNMRRGSRALLFTLASILTVGGAALLFFKGDAQWMLYGGIAAAASGVVMFALGAWKN